MKLIMKKAVRLQKIWKSNKKKRNLLTRFLYIEELRNICWKGIPSEAPLIKAESWKILLCLYPLKKELKISIIQGKKKMNI